MRRFGLFAVAILTAAFGFAQDAGPYMVLRTAKVGGAGGFDYVNADDAVCRFMLLALSLVSVFGRRLVTKAWSGAWWRW